PPWGGVPMDVVVASGLRPGLELDRPRLRRLRSELRRAEALATAGRLLRYRELAAERLEDELARRGIAPVERREAVGALARAGLVDDRRLALSRARSLADRGYGDEAIRWRLAQAGLADELAEEALAEIEPELERARRLA